MNTLPIEKKASVISMLCEGSSIRSIERITGIHRDTIMRLSVRVGQACAKLLDEKLRGLAVRYAQCDELWTFCRVKQKHLKPLHLERECGDQWIYVGLDSETKLVASYLVGKRNATNTRVFIRDLASRLSGRVQISTDQMSHYIEAIEEAFGGDCDYGQIAKSYESEPVGPGRYAPPRVKAVERTALVGEPEESRISTSHVERSNLSMRTQMRRLTRLALGFSKKLDNLKAAVSLYFGWYNFVKVHKTLRVTPAVRAGVAGAPWTVMDLVKLSEK